jgi:2-polyprenyl-6-methoxyphenol hydroxylase-like FAD-dependent oxidoreductase
VLDVVVVGAGPVGLAAAAGFAARGASVEVVERRSRRWTTSRAAAVHAGTLAVLERLGVTDDLVASGLPLQAFDVVDPHRLLFRVDFTRLTGVRPYALAVPQWRTEELLARRVAELGVPVSSGESVREVRPGLVRTDSRELPCRLVVGADGVHSTVRASLGIGTRGRRNTDHYVLADVDLSTPPPDDRVVLHVAGPGGLVVAPLPDGSTRLIAAADAPAEPPELQRLVDTRAPGVGEVGRVHWISGFEVSRQLADRFDADGAVLLGDAAHQHSPSGGQGMNLGLRDAASVVDPGLDFLATGRPLEQWARARRAYAAQVVRFTRGLTLLETGSSTTRRVLDEVVYAARGSRRIQAELVRRLAGVDDPVL